MDITLLRNSLLTAVLAGGIAVSLHGQVNFADFEAYNDGDGPVMFQNPGFSGSTSGHLAASSPTVVDANFRPGSNVLTSGFTFNAGDTTWLRLTTHNTPEIPNPTISLQDPLSFDFFSTEPVYLALGIRTTGTTAEFGANGGTSGAIHWVSLGPQDPGTGFPPRGNEVPANTWVTLTFDIPTEVAAGNHRHFAGSGGSLTDPRGVLEHLAIAPVDTSGIAHTIYMDNFTVVPEPSTYAAIFGGLALLGAFVYRRRLSAKK